MKNLTRIAASTAALAVTLAGCGGSATELNDGGSSASGSGSTVASAAGSIAGEPPAKPSSSPPPSGSKYVTSDKVSQQLLAALKRSAPDRDYDGDPVCGPLAATVGATATCSIVVDGATIVYDATVTSVEGETVNFEFVPSDEVAPDAAVPPEDDVAPSQAADTMAYGQTYTSSTGRQIMVSQPKPFKPSDSAYVPEEQFTKYIRMTVKLVNKNAEPFDTNELMFEATSGERESSGVADTAAGIDTPTSTILPGRTLSFDLAFGYTPGQPFTLAISTFEGPVVTYDGVVK